MNKTEAARLANERKASALEDDLIEAMRYSPEGMYLSSGECARFLATGFAPAGSIKIYLQLYRRRGDESKFYRLFTARPGPALTRHNALHPKKLGVWVNRDGPPPEPTEPEPLPAPEPTEPEPLPAPAPETMYWPNDNAPSPEQDRLRYFNKPSRGEPKCPVHNYRW